MIVESPEFWEADRSLEIYEWLNQNGCPVRDERGDPGMELVLRSTWFCNPGSKKVAKTVSIFAFKKRMTKRPWAVILESPESDLTKGWACTNVDEAEQVLALMLEEKAPDAVATYGVEVNMFPKLIAWAVARELNNEN